MADIFFSYAKVDRNRVKPLIDALEAEPWRVWWDDDLSPGGSWSEEIKTELYAARSAVVAWTNASINSEFVQDESRRAHKAHKLVPVMLDVVDLPMGFGGVQTIDFSGWNGDRNAVEFIKLREAIKKTLASVARHTTVTPLPVVAGPEPEPAALFGTVPIQAAGKSPAGLKPWLFALAALGAVLAGAYAYERENSPAWEDHPPNQAYCFQRKDSPAAPGKFLVRCFQTENGCATFQPTDSGQKTPCTLARGLTGAAVWQDAGKGGAGDSWFKYSPTEFTKPFPEF